MMTRKPVEPLFHHSRRDVMVSGASLAAASAATATSALWTNPATAQQQERTTAPAGHEGEWIKTIPGKGWFVYFRIYGPEQAAFDGSWKPDDFVEMK